MKPKFLLAPFYLSNIICYTCLLALPLSAAQQHNDTLQHYSNGFHYINNEDDSKDDKKEITATDHNQQVFSISLVTINCLRLYKKKTSEILPNSGFYRLAEMPSSMLKKAYINHLKIMDNNSKYSEAFSLNKDSLTSTMLVACLLMAIQKHELARNILNKKQEITVNVLNLLCNHASTRMLMAQLKLYENKPLKEVARNIILLIEKIDLTPDRYKHSYIKGSYSSYYKDKKENIALHNEKNWNPKQKSVYKALCQSNPKKVLDLGANTGWFSELSASLGATVIAIDIDEYCMDFLYKKAQSEKLTIHPFVLSFQFFLASYKSEKSFRETIDRFKADTVLALAFIHHLVLVWGLKLEEIFELLAKLTTKILILEFVSIEDERIQKVLDPSQQRVSQSAYDNIIRIFNTYAAQNYNLNNVLEIGKKYFRSVEVLESNPKTRKILVFKK